MAPNWVCTEGPDYGPCPREQGLPQYTDGPLKPHTLGPRPLQTELWVPVDVNMCENWVCIEGHELGPYPRRQGPP